MLPRMTMTTRFGRVALSALLVAGLAACKKDKKDEGAAKGTGTAVGTGTAAGSGTGTAAKVEGGQAMSAIKGAIAMADGKDAPSSGGLGGMGAALGGLFGGGRPSAAIAPMGEDKQDKPSDPSDPLAPTSVDVGDEQPPTDPGMDMFANVQLPPAGKPGGDCTAVADRVDAIVRAVFTSQVGQLDADTRKMVEAQVEAEIGKVKTQMLEMCTSQNWPTVLKDCLLTAADMTALQGCEQHMTAEMKAGPPSDPDEPLPAPATPVPAWSGGDDCNAVGERIAQLAMGQVGDMSPEEKQMMMASMKDAMGEIVTACTAGSWSAEVRGCFFKAASIDDAEGCFRNAGL